MLFKEEIENILRRELYSSVRDGDTIRALTELYNLLPSSEASVPVRGLDIDIIPYKGLLGEASSKTVNFNTLRELQELADELNEAEPIDWEDNNQLKVYIEYSYTSNQLMQSFTYILKDLNICCTSGDFLEKAKERIGEDRLIKLFKEGI